MVTVYCIVSKHACTLGMNLSRLEGMPFWASQCCLPAEECGSSVNPGGVRALLQAG